MNKKIMLIDIDDTCFSLVDNTLKRYNEDYSDSLSPEDITEWNISKFAKCGKRIYEYFEDPSIYDDIEIISGAKQGIQTLKDMGYRVVFATHSTVGASGRKYKLLKDYSLIEREDDYIEAKDKSLITCNYMIDDKYENVVNCFGEGFLFSQPWNKQYTHKRFSNWSDIRRYFIALKMEG